MRKTTLGSPHAIKTKLVKYPTSTTHIYIIQKPCVTTFSSTGILLASKQQVWQAKTSCHVVYSMLSSVGMMPHNVGAVKCQIFLVVTKKQR